MTCLNERMVGAVALMLSGFAFAGDLTTNLPEEMKVSNIAPMPMEVLAPIPEPKRYLPQRYAMEYQPDQSASKDTQFENFYSAEVLHDFHYGAASTSPSPQLAAQPASSYLRLQTSTAVLSLVDQPNATLTLRAQPQRRLSLTVDQWVFSATARIAILRSHSTGATVTVRRGF